MYEVLKLLNKKDDYLLEHSKRVSELSAELAGEMGFNYWEIIKIKRGALFHDIGKRAIDSNILNKPARLTEKEAYIIKKHPFLGIEIVKDIISDNIILDIIKYHHERWDGDGYPECLQGKQIPLWTRIVTVTDAFDAMTSFRSYKDKTLGRKKAVDMLWENAGRQFDKDIVEVFTRIINIKNKRGVS